MTLDSRHIPTNGYFQSNALCTIMQESSTIENMLLCWIEAENASDWLLARVTGSSGGSAVSVEHEAELKRWAIFIFQPTPPPPHLMHTHCLFFCSLQSLSSLSIFCLVQSQGIKLADKDIKSDTRI